MSNNWITVATFSQGVDAHLARTRLEAEGIHCIVSDEFLVRVNWLLSNAVGGVKLMVPAWEAERAREILRPKPRLVVAADPNERDPDEPDLICPRCHSYDVYYHRFNKRIANLVVLFFGFTVPWLSRKWICKQCDYQWRSVRTKSRR